MEDEAKIPRKRTKELTEGFETVKTNHSRDDEENENAKEDFEELLKKFVTPKAKPVKGGKKKV